MSLNTQTEHVVPVESSNQETMGTRQGSNLKLLVCFLGIFISYFIYGVLQEKIVKTTYGPDNEKFTFTLALVFVQCIINGMFAQCVILLSRAGPETAPQRMYAVMSFSYLGAMVASNHALQYVTYPTQVLGKSVKPIPIMILGVLLAGKKYPFRKYMFVLTIVLGVALFLYKDKKAQSVDSDHTLGFGELLLLASLLLDGVTGGVQDKIRAEHTTQTHRMMYYMNLWSVFYLFFALAITGEGIEFLTFVNRFPAVLLHMLSFSLCSAIGQNFIFMTVTNFGPLMCSIITTTRKFFTILGSVLIFGHAISSRQWLGTVLVFIGLGLDSAFGKNKPAAPK